MFLDTFSLEIQGGDGGSGFVSFHRTRRRPQGEADGGDGGRGGSVIFRGSTKISNLNHLQRYTNPLKAQSGSSGLSKGMTGKNGQDLVVELPVVSKIYHRDLGLLLSEIDSAGKTFLAANGGKGGRGNGSLINQRNKRPVASENGLPGEPVSLTVSYRHRCDLALVVLGDPEADPILRQVTGGTLKRFGILAQAPKSFLFQDDFREYRVLALLGKIQDGRPYIPFLHHASTARAIIISIGDQENLEPRTVISDAIDTLVESSPDLPEIIALVGSFNGGSRLYISETIGFSKSELGKEKHQSLLESENHDSHQVLGKVLKRILSGAKQRG